VDGTFRLGVDFGTSNTVALLSWPDGRVRPLLFDGSPTLPSAVYLDDDRRFLVGRDARHAARARPECFEPHPKRCVDDGVVLLGGWETPVVALIAAVLRRVAEEASRTAGAAIREVTLTHPAVWGVNRRSVLAEAAAAVGWADVRLVPEPVAAAAYFVSVLGSEVPIGSSVVVYDLGGGTFDASVVRRTGGGFEILASEGIADAGGLDVDAAVVAYLGTTCAARAPAEWQRIVNPGTSVDRRARYLLWEDVRGAKEMLSREPRTVIPVPFIDDELPLGREQLEELARPVLDRTVAVTRNTIRASGVPAQQIRALFLVGGASRIPLAGTLLMRALHITPTSIEQPELAVGEGSLASGHTSPVPASVAPAPADATEPVTAAPAPTSATAPRRPGRWRRIAWAGAVWAVTVAVTVTVSWYAFVWRERERERQLNSDARPERLFSTELKALTGGWFQYLSDCSANTGSGIVGADDDTAAAESWTCDMRLVPSSPEPHGSVTVERYQSTEQRDRVYPPIAAKSQSQPCTDGEPPTSPSASGWYVETSSPVIPWGVSVYITWTVPNGPVLAQFSYSATNPGQCMDPARQMRERMIR
jgi:Ethanolamine utilization protein EutJ (predicted chaperonin)